jgi:protein-disulfide isomerase
MAQIETTLRQARQAEARRRFVDTLRNKSRVRILLEAPRVEINAGTSPSRGPATAPVTIVEFSDFQCPYCRAASGTLKALEQRYGNKVRIVYRDFPLPNHNDAPKASEAAACAHEQGRFWQMHDKLFEGRSGLQIAELKRYARDIGLDTVRFDACLDSGTREAVWRQNRAEGQRVGVSATPTFFINGRMLTGARPVEAFAEIIDEELGRVATMAAR